MERCERGWRRLASCNVDDHHEIQSATTVDIYASQRRSAAQRISIPRRQKQSFLVSLKKKGMERGFVGGESAGQE